MRKRVLVVNTFFDEYRRTAGSPARVPRAMGPVFLAGAFNPATTEVQIYNEQQSGPLHDPALLGWPDLLVLTGLTASFDRMLHLTAYARALNPRVIVAAGGPAVRALPRLSARFFDHAATGDIEALADIAREALGPDHVAESMEPRFDLVPPKGVLAYAESSRACNFRCAFCSLTAEGGRYRTYDLGYLRRQLEAAGKRHIVFIDNNFYGNDRSFFLDRVALLGDFVKSGRIRSWSALVTGDFFTRPGNIEAVRDAGCFALFSGVESFDTATLKAQNKRHSALLPQVQMIRSCLEAGMLFLYGIMLDPSTRRLTELRAEIDFILGTPEITLPAYFTLAIPLLGTPHFRQCLEQRLILPGTRLRDLDGVSLALRPLDPLEEAAAFARDLPNIRGFRRKLPAHVARFLGRYRRRLSPLQLAVAAGQAALIGIRDLASSPLSPRLSRPRQTFVTTSESLDGLYRPVMRLPARLAGHFRPTMVTDAAGDLAPELADDLARPLVAASTTATAPVPC